MNIIHQQVFDILDSMEIEYGVVEHPAVYTIEEMDQLQIDSKDEIVKNLFVRDDKKNRYFVIVLQKTKTVNLKDLRQRLDCRPLSFASEEDLQRYLNLNKGAVTPLGVLNDEARRVEVVIDQDILRFDQVGVHPNDNTATVWLRPQDLEAVIKSHGNTVCYIEI
ncbi:prolyl-tRNA synthetase associated domain-containing protein [Paenibacillus lutimineralis]|uniref:Prolyl-tRNA synthetase associated domain-containing protein n=1 Tax=Paenibacillus lutimineralis TaxID=2707005 RepID=A0A3Q9I915_9BACL|nr:prolyl-tRNA synthetase associated domain-containing protein [Paenibacillus lutimineralis]AZS13833.1 prolyl-tRNA synthetase associated domain-containing protein [Paenibacillus lutimineralis]